MGFFGSLWNGVKGLVGGITGDAALGVGASIAGNLMGAEAQKSANETNLKINQLNNEFNERMAQKQMDYNTAMYNQQYKDNVAMYNQQSKDDIAKMNMQNDFNAQQAEKANQFTLDMFHRVNEYNSPSALRQRIEEAEMNPYMLLNGGSFGIASGGGSTSASSGSGGSTSFSSPSGASAGMASAGASGNAQGYNYNFQGIPNAIIQGKQGKIMDEQYKQWVMDNQTRAQKNLEEINYLISKTKNEDIKHKLSTVQYRYADELQQLSIQNMKQTNENMVTQQKNMIREGLLMQKELDIFDEKTKLMFANMIAERMFTQAQTRTEKQRLVNEIQNMYETVARTAGIKISNDVAKRSADSLVEKAFQESHPQTMWGTITRGYHDIQNHIKSWW